MSGSLQKLTPAANKESFAFQKQHRGSRNVTASCPPCSALPAPWPHVHMATGGLVPVHCNRPVPSLKDRAVGNFGARRIAGPGLPTLKEGGSSARPSRALLCPVIRLARALKYRSRRSAFFFSCLAAIRDPGKPAARAKSPPAGRFAALRVASRLYVARRFAPRVVDGRRGTFGWA